jgi:hypothetical protein
MFRDVMVTSYFSKGTYHAHIINDNHDKDFKKVTFKVETFDYNQRDAEPKFKWSKEIDVESNSAELIYSVDIGEMMEHEDDEDKTKVQENPRTTKYFFVRASATMNEGEVILDTSYTWPEYTKNSILSKDMQPNLTTTILPVSDTEVKIILMNEKDNSYPSIYTSLVSDSIPGFFSENVFFLLPSEAEVVTFTSKDPVKNLKEELEKSLHVMSYNKLLTFATKK